jgi:pentapeptide repeat protein
MANPEHLVMLKRGVEVWNRWRRVHVHLEVDLSGASLRYVGFVETNLEGANLTGCSVYGISAWNVRLKGAIQSNLVITPSHESAIQVDNLEVAQFIYLLLNNEKIRNVIDTITSKVVLILGRFTPERKVVLDAIREELRKRDYLPILFDFEKPAGKDLTGTISTLANMARFIIADLTDPSSVPHELAMVVPGTIVPVQPILLEGQQEYAMFVDLKKRYHWVLEPYQYKSEKLLIADLSDWVIGPAEAKAKEQSRK